MKYVIIPSAKYCPRELSNYGMVPMALLPVNEKTILELILESYDSSFSFVVSTFEGSEEIFNYVRTIKTRNVVACKVNSARSLIDTINDTMNSMNICEEDELVLNFGDTVVSNKYEKKDAIICSKSNKIEKRWTYIKCKDGYISEVIDKEERGKNYNDFFVVCGVFYIQKPLLFKSIIVNEIEHGERNFYKALQQYSMEFGLSVILAEDWLDLGHRIEFFDSSTAIRSRSFNHVSIDKNRGKLRKTSDNLEKFRYEIMWYVDLPKDINYVTPRIFDYSLDYNNTFIEMEYYSYPTLLELSLYGNLSEETWRRIFKRIRFVLKDFSKYRIFDKPNIIESLIDMYDRKTIERLGEMRNDPVFAKFFGERISINGHIFLPLNDVLEIIHNCSSELLDIDSFCIIHGDLCFSNILIDDNYNFIKLIDPRGIFGTCGIYGDQRYDLAKLFHSIDGKYDFIIKDRFSIDVNHNEIFLKIEQPKLDLFSILIEEFDDILEGCFRQVEIIEALMFLSMIPLHSEDKNHQLAMLATGLLVLSRNINIEIKDKNNGK